MTICMRKWQVIVDNTRRQTEHALPTDQFPHHHVSAACRPEVLSIPLFKGFSNIPYTPLPTGYPMGTNEATMTPILKNAPCWHDSRVSDRYVRAQKRTQDLARLPHTGWLVLHRHPTL